jgi:hypothetical protein
MVILASVGAPSEVAPLTRPWRAYVLRMGAVPDLSTWVPETRYARNGDAHIAYQVFGAGDVTIAGLPGIVSNIEVAWEDPESRLYLTGLASIARVVHYVAGIGVHIAARVAALADSGELLASRTVKDLVAGSDYAFESRGVHSLKGVPEEWELLAVT